MDNLADQVIAMVAEDRGLPAARIDRASRLVDDLGMDGDEADEFFVAFRARFGADLAPLQAHWGRHFGPEVEWRLGLGVPVGLVLAGLGVGMKSIWVGWRASRCWPRRSSWPGGPRARMGRICRSRSAT